MAQAHMTEERLKDLEKWARQSIRDHVGQPLGKSGEAVIELIDEVRRLRAQLQSSSNFGLDSKVFR